MKKPLSLLYSLAIFMASFNVAALAVVAPLVLFVEKRVLAKISPTRLMLLALVLLELIVKLYVILLLEPWSFETFLRDLSMPVILISFLLISISDSTRKLLCYVAVCLFILDLSVNLYAICFGADLFGREISQRETDLFPRLIGLLGHPFASINISFIGFIAALWLNAPWCCVLSVSSLLLTGSQRGPVIAALLIVALLLIRRRSTSFFALIYPYLFAIAIIALTFFAASTEMTSVGHVLSSNQLRTLLWLNAISVLPQALFLGVRNLTEFEYDPNVGVSFESLSSSGVAESFLLQSFVDYGVFIFVAKALFLLVVMIQFVRFYSKASSRQLPPATVFAIALVSESIFGTSVASSVYVSIYYGAFCLSNREIF